MDSRVAIRRFDGGLSGVAPIIAVTSGCLYIEESETRRGDGTPGTLGSTGTPGAVGPGTLEGGVVVAKNEKGLDSE